MARSWHLVARITRCERSIPRLASNCSIKAPIATGCLRRAFASLPGRIFKGRFSADGNRILVGSSFEGRGEARVYQTTDGKLLAQLEGQRGGVFAVAFRPDGKQVATAGFDGVVRLNDPQTGKLIKEFVPVPLAPTVTARAK